jgi:hypothetical protein
MEADGQALGLCHWLAAAWPAEKLALTASFQFRENALSELGL